MQEKNANQYLGDLYRQHMKQELSRPEVAQAKAALLAQFMPPASVSVFSFSAMAPALCLIVLFAFSWQLVDAPMKHRAGRLAPIALQSTENVRTVQAKQNEKTIKTVTETSQKIMKILKPRVQVKSVSSDVGPTMVYQKMYQKSPVTIVWVFSGGQKA